MENNLFDMYLLEGKEALPPNTQIIDFGIGKIAVTLQPGSSLDVVDFIEAIKGAALVVPLHRLTAAIKNYNRF